MQRFCNSLECTYRMPVKEKLDSFLPQRGNDFSTAELSRALGILDTNVHEIGTRAKGLGRNKKADAWGCSTY